MYRIFDAQHVYKFLRNLETRMYRNFVAQHGYEPIGSEPRTMLKILHSFYIILTEGSDRNVQKQECQESREWDS